MPIVLPTIIESVDEDIAEILHSKSPAQRVQMAAEANDTARLLSAAGIRYAVPQWSEVRIQQKVVRRMLNATS